MDDSFDAIFSHKPQSEVTHTEVVDTPAEDTVDTVVDAPVDTDVAATETPKVEEVVAPKEDRKNWVPVDALIEERTKRQEAEKARADYETKLRELESQNKQQTRPDPFDSPDEYETHIEQKIAQAIQADRMARDQEELQKNFGASLSKAEQSHGKETIKAALDWAAERAQKDEAWGQTGLSNPDPVAWILEQKNRHALIDEISSAESIEDYIARKAAEMGIAGTASVATAQTNNMAAKVAAPKSLASAGSNGRNTSNGKTGDDAFNAIFKK